MGKGVALEARNRFKDIDLMLGKCKQHQALIEHSGKHIISFPTKYHYNKPSNLHLIKFSCKSLVSLVTQHNLLEKDNVYLPKVGCGLGGLDYKTQIKPVLLKYLQKDINTDNDYIVLV